MSDQLRVLVLESERGVGDAARADLANAGHTTLRCHEPGRAAFPCNALTPGNECPLKAGVVDVALDVRKRPRSQPAPQEDGVSCVLASHVPLVVAGSQVLNPFADYATEIVDGSSDLVAACERAAAAPLVAHTDAALGALRDFLFRRGIAAQPTVSVRRKHGALIVKVGDAAELDRGARSMAAVRITAAVRAIDRDARGLEVSFSD